MKRILIIKLGALGDFAQAFSAFEAIRAHFASDHLTLLTTSPYQALAYATGYFDEIWTKGRPRWLDFPEVISLFRKLYATPFSWVFDLQNSSRTRKYFYLWGWWQKSMKWSADVKGCSHPHSEPERLQLSVTEDLAAQLKQVDIRVPRYPALSWVSQYASRIELPHPYVLLEPGSSPTHLVKRWTVEGYQALCRWLLLQGITPVVDGTASEAEMCQAIIQSVPGIISTVGKTTMLDILLLARQACLVVGGDTGPMHLAAQAGGRCLVLFSDFAKPERSAPHGAQVSIIQKASLKELSAEEVIVQAQALLE